VQVAQLSMPGTLASIEDPTLRRGQRRQRVTPCRVQPAAADIERYALKRQGSRAPTEPRQRFDEQHRALQRRQAPRRSDSCGTTSDNGHIYAVHRFTMPAWFSNSQSPCDIADDIGVQ
jgi:hypothetical protein